MIQLQDICNHCEEPILPGEVYLNYANGPSAHKECFIRAIVGSVGHQRGECSCYGKLDTSEEGKTQRQAAIEAFNHWLKDQTQPAKAHQI